MINDEVLSAFDLIKMIAFSLRYVFKGRISELHMKYLFLLVFLATHLSVFMHRKRVCKMIKVSPPKKYQYIANLKRNKSF